MGAGIDLEFIRDRYASMSGEELTRFITLEGAGITEEAFALARAEVQKRGLNIQLSNALDVLSQEEYTIEEIDAYCDILSKLDCPVCFSRHKKLNAVRTAGVLSFIFYTVYRNQVKIGCRECLEKDEFRNFAVNNMAGIEAFKNNREELQNIISRQKNRNLTAH